MKANFVSSLINWAQFGAGILLLTSCAMTSAQGTNLVADPGFELQTTNTVSAPWNVEGPDPHGIDRGIGNSHSGANNAWINDSTTNWNAITQWINVSPNTNYTLTGFFQNNFGSNVGFFGVRESDGSTVLAQTTIPTSGVYLEQMVNFNSGPYSRILVFFGFWGQGTGYFLRIDDITLKPTIIPPPSSFASTIGEEGYSTYQMAGGDGDLWPSCWASDGNLYAANGDGAAFTGGSRFDMAVSRISGTFPNLSGTTTATNVGSVYASGTYNRKPTGMVCINGAIYLAFQNINDSTFNDVPAASIAESTDDGVTWSWNTSTPMFGTPGTPNSATAYKFTTIFFLDYGQNSQNAIDGYVYAYGLDNNWRGQMTVYLARVPNSSIQNRSTWTFFTGRDGNGNPLWSSDITVKVPVLEDDRLLYQTVRSGSQCPANEPVIGQGGVTYDAPLQRYIFSSWTCATHELYEAPQPWGPWNLMPSKDFGASFPATSRGMYGTSIPSKFISADGKTLMLQSNICCGINGDPDYTFSLRNVYLVPFQSSTATNTVSDSTNLAAPTFLPRATSKSTHYGALCGAGCSDMINNGLIKQTEDDMDMELKPTDWWGYTWPQAYNMNKVVYWTGNMYSDGGWFGGGLNVQVRQDFVWANVTNLTITPAYPYSNGAGNNTAYTFRFNPTWGDGVRIIGSPGGTSDFTSIGRMDVYYDSGNNVGSIWQYVGPPCNGTTCAGWQPLDNNPLAIAVVAGGSNVYKLHSDGSIWQHSGSGWTELDNNTRAIAIAADSTNLYELHNDGAIWRYVGPACNQGTCPGWQELDNNPAATAIAASGGNFYELHNNGQIWKYTGTPCNGNSCPGWQELDINPLAISIVADGSNFYQLHNDGSIWRYVGPPCSGGSCNGWQELNNNTATTSIVASGGNLYELHNNGEIWQYTGTPCNGNSCPGWQKLDNNPLDFAMAADGSNLYELHADGAIWKYTGTPCNGNSCTGWQLLDDNVEAASIAAGGGTVYQLHSAR